MGSPVSAVIANLYMEVFEEQAIESAPYKPNIWKGYVDDTFTIMIAVLDTSVSREPYSRLTTSVYRKPTHPGQYLVYDSHHPQSVRRSIVTCLYNGAKCLLTKQLVIMIIPEEKKHLSSVLVSNRYPSSFVQKLPST